MSTSQAVMKDAFVVATNQLEALHKYKECAKAHILSGRASYDPARSARWRLLAHLTWTVEACIEYGEEGSYRCLQELLKVYPMLIHFDRKYPFRSRYSEHSALAYAVCTGELEVVKVLLEAGADANDNDALNVATVHGYDHILEALSVARVEKYNCKNRSERTTPVPGAEKPDMNAKDESGRTPLTMAAFKVAMHHLETMGKFEESANLNRAAGKRGYDRQHYFRLRLLDEHLKPQLFSLAQIGDIRAVQDLLNAFPALLHAQTAYGCLEYWEQDEYENVGNWEYYSPVMYAALCGRIDMVKFFLEAGAKLNNEDLQLCLELKLWTSIEWHEVRFVEQILSFYPKLVHSCEEKKYPWQLSSIDDYGPPLLHAVDNGDFEMVKVLLKAGADVNAESRNKNQTALMIAINLEHEDIVQTLIDAGAGIAASDPSESTRGVLACARKCHNANIVAIVKAWRKKIIKAALRAAAETDQLTDYNDDSDGSGNSDGYGDGNSDCKSDDIDDSDGGLGDSAYSDGDDEDDSDDYSAYADAYAAYNDDDEEYGVDDDDCFGDEDGDIDGPYF